MSLKRKKELSNVEEEILSTINNNTLDFGLFFRSKRRKHKPISLFYYMLNISDSGITIDVSSYVGDTRKSKDFVKIKTTTVPFSTLFENKKMNAQNLYEAYFNEKYIPQTTIGEFLKENLKCSLEDTNVSAVDDTERKAQIRSQGIDRVIGRTKNKS